MLQSIFFSVLIVELQAQIKITASASASANNSRERQYGYFYGYFSAIFEKLNKYFQYLRSTWSILKTFLPFLLSFTNCKAYSCPLPLNKFIAVFYFFTVFWRLHRNSNRVYFQGGGHYHVSEASLLDHFGHSKMSILYPISRKGYQYMFNTCLQF